MIYSRVDWIFHQMKYLLNHTAKIHKQIRIDYPNIRRHSKIPLLISSHLESQSNSIVLFSTNYHWSLIKSYDNEKISSFLIVVVQIVVKISEILPKFTIFLSLSSLKNK